MPRIRRASKLLASVPKSDFGAEGSSVAGEDGCELTTADVSQLGLEKRRYRRIELDRPATLRVGSLRHEGPCDVSRSGAALIVPLSPEVGARVQVVLPADEAEPAGLTLVGRVTRAVAIVFPVTRNGVALPTYHCFACGWNGYVDPSTGGLETSLKRGAEGTFGGETHISGARGLGSPASCPTCDAPAPLGITTPLYSVGVDFSSESWQQEECLLGYVERAVAQRGTLGRRKHERRMAEFVPVRLSCAFDDPDQLITAYLRDISLGGLSFDSTRQLRLGDEVRLSLEAGGKGFVLTAAIASTSLTLQGGRRYGAQFLKFDEDRKRELRAFIESATNNALSALERTTHTRSRRGRLSRDLMLGLGSGWVIGLGLMLALALR